MGLGKENECQEVLGWDGECSYAISNNKRDSYVIIDSVTQYLPIPADTWPEITDDTKLIITVGGVELTIEVETLNNWKPSTPFKNQDPIVLK